MLQSFSVWDYFFDVSGVQILSAVNVVRVFQVVGFGLISWQLERFVCAFVLFLRMYQVLFGGLEIFC